MTPKDVLHRDESQRKVIRCVLSILIGCMTIVFLATLGNVAHAAGLVDDTINSANEYSKYGLNNYQLDFYVDNGWAWLPWNWSDGLGKSVMYGLYAITNFIWIISLYLSNATGYLVQEAYSLDFISETADAIGKNIQTIAGVNQNGFSSSGFFVGFLLIFILILGIYVAYTGVIKRETTKAVQAIINFLVVFILSASFIAYAPDYVGKINDFSRDISNASLDVGTRIVMPNSETQGKDSVDMIRDSLFSIQVKQPWLLLQYGSTEVDEARAERLLSISPDTNNGQDRETVVIDEIENQGNANLSIAKVISRLGTVFFLFIFNIGISIFVFLLTGIMIFSQVLFIIYAMFLPISFLLSMIPSFDGMAKRSITRLFNVIMTRAGITLIITVAFSISTMLYSLAASSPFFMIMFLQIVTFAGIYFKLGDIMSMFALQSGDSQGIGRRMFRRPRMLMYRYGRQFQRRMGRAFGGSSRGGTAAKADTRGPQTKAAHASHEHSERASTTSSASTNASATNKRANKNVSSITSGGAVNNDASAPGNAPNTQNNPTVAPVNVKHGQHKGKRGLVSRSDRPSDTDKASNDAGKPGTQQEENRPESRKPPKNNLAGRRMELERARQGQSHGRAQDHNRESASPMPVTKTPTIKPHERVNTKASFESKKSTSTPKGTQKQIIKENRQTSKVRTNKATKRTTKTSAKESDPKK